MLASRCTTRLAKGRTGPIKGVVTSAGVYYYGRLISKDLRMSLVKSARITALYRYPVKGLSPEKMDHVAVEAGKTFPFDRAFAIENGSSGFQIETPAYLPKINFLMLMKQEKLAALDSVFDDETQMLTLSRDGHLLASGSLKSSDGRAAIERYFSENFDGDLRGKPTVLRSEGFSFSDVAEKCVSIINMESVRDLAKKIGKPVDPLRFRGNIYVDNIPAWSEFDWLENILTGSNVSLQVFSQDQTVRCDQCRSGHRRS